MKKVFVFDADDTLWMNEWQYSAAYAQYFAFIYQIFRECSPTLKYLNRRFFQIDIGLYRVWGIRRGRVAESMRLCYQEICAWAKARFGHEFMPVESIRHYERMAELGDLPFDFMKLLWRPDALDALKVLKRRGYTLCLLTSYDPEVFPARAARMEIDRFFTPEHVRAIPGSKTKDDFIKVSGWTPENDAAYEWYAVGNGESDLKPALEISARWRGFYMPHGSTSKFFYHEESSNDYPEPIKHFMPPSFVDPRVQTINTLKDILKLL